MKRNEKEGWPAYQEGYRLGKGRRMRGRESRERMLLMVMTSKTRESIKPGQGQGTK